VAPRKPKKAAVPEAPPLPPEVAHVALPVPLRQTFTYRVPPALRGRVRPGVRVRVPFGARKLVGVCVSVEPEAPPPPPALAPAPAPAPATPTLFGDISAPAPAAAPRGAWKDVEKVLDAAPALSAALLELTRFVAEYYRCSWGEALEAALPGSVKRRIRKDAPAAPAADTVAAAPSPHGDAPGGPETALEATFSPEKAPEPTREQIDALEVVLGLVRAGRFGTALVHGVTGSGKTEVYMRAIEETVALGRSAILLVPEIALTPQTQARLKARFQDVALLHSMQGDAERARQWESVRAGRVRVVIGPRSAVFAPVTALGLIVVDEEHDGSFKQQDNPPRYHARDVAVVRARLEGAVAVLGSATPSLESYRNAQEGRYRALRLMERATRARLPAVEVVDLRDEAKQVDGFPFISRRLAQVLGEALARREQAILFLNRRGFATFLQCRSCKHVLTCKACDVALTFHKGLAIAACHYCESQEPPPRRCPTCLSGEVQYFGLGTERVEEEVRRRFPAARVERVDSDSVTDTAALEGILARFGALETDILIGTQMVAKGLDFPRVTVVGVISADTAINLPDFRAAERTFQLVSQVTGRAGRAELPGVAVVQTFSPDHPAVLSAVRHDSTGFLQGEMKHREKLGYPPFTRLVRLVVSGPDEAETARAAETVAGALRFGVDQAREADAAASPPVTREPARILGPAPAPISSIRGRHRFVILVKGKDRKALEPVLDAADALPRLPTSIRVTLDVDPTSML